RTCSADSTAVANNTSRPEAAAAIRTWRTSVDFPTPGSPESRLTEPATNPPPRTRSSSPTPVGRRPSTAGPTSDTGTAVGAEFGAARRTGVARDSTSSIIVFHSPQPGQRPTQRGAVVPHSVQA